MGRKNKTIKRRKHMNKQLAIKLNTEIIRYSKSPHERDLARMRINILKKALKRKKEKGL